ncbi:MAG TPA: hypothetical protein DIU20_07890 [Cryomorphaceae bacterium]|nr:hypothetical protein [Cryomorphaceae bacterium]
MVDLSEAANAVGVCGFVISATSFSQYLYEHKIKKFLVVGLAALMIAGAGQAMAYNVYGYGASSCI